MQHIVTSQHDLGAPAPVSDTGSPARPRLSTLSQQMSNSGSSSSRHSSQVQSPGEVAPEAGSVDAAPEVGDSFELLRSLAQILHNVEQSGSVTAEQLASQLEATFVDKDSLAVVHQHLHALSSMEPAVPSCGAATSDASGHPEIASASSDVTSVPPAANTSAGSRELIVSVADRIPHEVAGDAAARADAEAAVRQYEPPTGDPARGRVVRPPSSWGQVTTAQRLSAPSMDSVLTADTVQRLSVLSAPCAPDPRSSRTPVAPTPPPNNRSSWAPASADWFARSPCFQLSQKAQAERLQAAMSVEENPPPQDACYGALLSRLVIPPSAAAGSN